MYTILDEGHTWFLDDLSYKDELTITLIEGILRSEPENIKILNSVIRDAYPIDILPTSRQVLIRFSQFVAWQVVDESFTSFDEYEQRDDKGFIQILARSKYFDYVNTSHGWYPDIIGTGKHYRIWTCDEVIDIVSCTEPIIELIT